MLLIEQRPPILAGVVGYKKREKTNTRPTRSRSCICLEDWMKRSFVSCNSKDTGKMLTKTALIVKKVLNLKRDSGQLFLFLSLEKKVLKTA